MCHADISRFILLALWHEGCQNLPVYQLLTEHIATMQRRFGADNYFVEMIDNNLPQQRALLNAQQRIAEHFNLPLLAQQLKPLAVFAVDNERSMTRAQLPTTWQHCWHDDFSTAWQSIAAAPDTHPLVICGSFYGLGEALALLSTHDEWELR